MKLLSTLLLFSISFSAQAFDWIAHRGNAGNATENTVDAVHASWAAHANAVELDVRISKDGIPYLFHDAEMNGVDLSVLPFNEITQLQSEIEVPTLASILALKRPSGYYLLDLKQPQTGDIDHYVAAVKESSTPPHRVAFQSDDIKILQAIQDKLPESTFFYLDRLERKAPFFQPPKPESILNNLAGTQIDGLSIKGRKFIDEPYIQSLKATGLRVNVWTINNAERADFYRSIGVDGLITDRVESFRTED